MISVATSNSGQAATQRLLDQPRLRQSEIAAARSKNDRAGHAHSAFRSAQRRFTQPGRIQHPFPRRNEPAAEIMHVSRNNLLTGSDLLPPERERLLRNRLQRVDVVKKNALHLVHIRRNVPRHRNVDNEKRPVEPIMQKRREVLPS